MDYLATLTNIKAIILDIDGVFTDNKILVTEEGHFLRTMNVRDGYSLKRAIQAGLKIGIISGGKSIGTKKRMEVLGITDVHLGIDEKLPVMLKLLEDWNITTSECAYMGDDIPDIDCMRIAGLGACPNDSVAEVINIAQYISPIKGGEGCVRDLVEKILEAKHLW
jgi:3-deoxy-D-manno-octulosonate 8-phosphate phosphatase (KDO 8-P phosphatase)